ncbi:bi-domain-containing oxidoreductase [Undibacter mobilis]|uniref:Oxidoreductase n=1 Tax=Undibacter mobilis TaxID=2292256 RepID=A0A371BDE9_9BRAD|nr:bi-domain-containing oxidoreductase [Undibacter mobilis]RDV05619.1 oxidoreductase [Undibacter mobilis]
MKQVFLQGGIRVMDVPAPQVGRGEVLVRAAASCISVGTEMAGVKASDMPLWKRALKRPDQVRRVIDMVRTQGFAKTQQLVRSHLGQAQPLGYSLAGTVIAVGDGVDDIFPGDRVACAGSQAAFHAEYVSVPRNLVVATPDAVTDKAAATVALGAIALHGIRRAEPTLGETFVVIGLGMLGQLTARLLKASGVRTVGADLDASRVALARVNGLDLALEAGDDAEQQVARLTGGVGADAVIVTAASTSEDLLGAALRICRRKGRVVLVGDVPIAFDRADVYAKEIDFRISSSYGPGRYDRDYEEGGVDYPLGYVRWTENRNMAAYLDLLAQGAVRIDDLTTPRFDISEAAAAYAALQGDGGDKPLSAILTYPTASDAAPVLRIANPAIAAGRPEALRLAVIGAGGFAKGTLLPIVKDEAGRFTLRTVCSRQGHGAASVAKQFGAATATTDIAGVLADSEIDAVMIATRHHQHADLVLKALQAGKHVFVEKPLCLTQAELDTIADFYGTETAGKPLVMTGFNRRFSKYAAALAGVTAARSNPMIIDYRVNAGYLPPDSWVHGLEGGGRNIGEACHFYDLFVMLTGAKALTVDATALRPRTSYYGYTDNFVASFGFADGSIAKLTYTALGASDFPKEQCDVYADGRVYSLNDFKRLSAAGANGPTLTSSTPDKGHREELIAFADAIRKGGAWPIPLWQQVEAMRMAFEVEKRIAPRGNTP